jgi:hypothetical protein
MYHWTQTRSTAGLLSSTVETSQSPRKAQCALIASSSDLAGMTTLGLYIKLKKVTMLF